MRAPGPRSSSPPAHPNIHRVQGPGSYPAKVAPRAARIHSMELNARMPTEWKGSKPSWEGKNRRTSRKQRHRGGLLPGGTCSLGEGGLQSPQKSRWGKAHVEVEIQSVIFFFVTHGRLVCLALLNTPFFILIFMDFSF